MQNISDLLTFPSIPTFFNLFYYPVLVGVGITFNLDEAKKWYMRSAAQGNRRAMQRLSELKKTSAAKAIGTGTDCVIS